MTKLKEFNTFLSISFLFMAGIAFCAPDPCKNKGNGNQDRNCTTTTIAATTKMTTKTTTSATTTTTDSTPVTSSMNITTSTIPSSSGTTSNESTSMTNSSISTTASPAPNDSQATIQSNITSTITITTDSPSATPSRAVTSASTIESSDITSTSSTSISNSTTPKDSNTGDRAATVVGKKSGKLTAVYIVVPIMIVAIAALAIFMWKRNFICQKIKTIQFVVDRHGQDIDNAVETSIPMSDMNANDNVYSEIPDVTRRPSDVADDTYNTITISDAGTDNNVHIVTETNPDFADGYAHIPQIKSNRPEDNEYSHIASGSSGTSSNWAPSNRSTDDQYSFALEMNRDPNDGVEGTYNKLNTIQCNGQKALKTIKEDVSELDPEYNHLSSNLNQQDKCGDEITDTYNHTGSQNDGRMDNVTLASSVDQDTEIHHDLDNTSEACDCERPVSVAPVYYEFRADDQEGSNQTGSYYKIAYNESDDENEAEDHPYFILEKQQDGAVEVENV